MSETFFDTCVNWSCVTRCGCQTTLSTLFTVYLLSYVPHAQSWDNLRVKTLGVKTNINNHYETQNA
jgi:hypothetical protein